MKYKIVRRVFSAGIAVVSFAVLFLPSFAWAEALPPVISAVQITGGEGKANEDFIELYNPNPSPVNINGYRLVKRSATGTVDTSIKSWSVETYIPAYSFYLWANSSFLGISVPPDTTTSQTLSDNNGIALRAGALDTGAVVDSLSWGTSTNGFANISATNPGAGLSLARVNLFGNLGFEIRASVPRNSFANLLPPSSEVEEIIPEELPAEVKDLVEDNSESIAIEQQSDLEPQNDTEPENSLGEASEPQQTDDSDPEIQPVVEVIQEEPLPQPAVDITQNESLQEPAPRTVRITEILPNPSGTDTGHEAIELYNYGSTTVHLDKWYLDDSDSILTADAWQISNLSVEPGNYIVLTIPSGKFVLNNTKGDKLGLFDKEKMVVDSVVYSSDAPEGKFYYLTDQKWYWGAASLGEPNILPPSTNPTSTQEIESEDHTEIKSILGLEFSEIYPAPMPGSEEFVEFYNNSDDVINLSWGKVLIGGRVYALPNVEITPGKYVAVYGKGLPFKLNDAGKQLVLIGQSGTETDSVAYGKAVRGQSYSKIDEEWAWTLAVTRGKVNELVVQAQSREKAQKPPSLPKPATPVAKSALSKVKSVKKTQTKPKQVTKASNNSNALVAKDKKSTEKQNKQVMQKSDENQQSKKNPAGLAAIAVASLGSGLFAVYKFGISV